MRRQASSARSKLDSDAITNMRDARARSVKWTVFAVSFVKGSERVLSSCSMIFLAAEGVITVLSPETHQHLRGEATPALVLR